MFDLTSAALQRILSIASRRWTVVASAAALAAVGGTACDGCGPTGACEGYTPAYGVDWGSASMSVSNADAGASSGKRSSAESSLAFGVDWGGTSSATSHSGFRSSSSAGVERGCDAKPCRDGSVDDAAAPCDGSPGGTCQPTPPCVTTAGTHTRCLDANPSDDDARVLGVAEDHP